MPLSFGFGKGQLLSKGQAEISVFVLDTYSGAAAAYSLRNLTSSYSSAVVRVRRSNDNAEADFTQAQIEDGSLASWVGAGNNGFVKIWYDQSGNNNHATQTVTSSQPKIVNAGSIITDGGKPAIFYADDGNNTFTLTTRLTTVQSTVCVWKQTFSAAYHHFLFGDTGATSDYHGAPPSSLGSVWLHPNNSNSIVKLGTNKINGVVTNLTTTIKQTTRVLLTMVHTSANATIATISKDRANANRSWKGYVQEIILYTSDQSTNMSGIETAINSYYSIY